MRQEPKGYHAPSSSSFGVTVQRLRRSAGEFKLLVPLRVRVKFELRICGSSRARALAPWGSPVLVPPGLSLVTITEVHVPQVHVPTIPTVPGTYGTYRRYLRYRRYRRYQLVLRYTFPARLCCSQCPLRRYVGTSLVVTRVTVRQKMSPAHARVTPCRWLATLDSCSVGWVQACMTK